MPKAFKGNHKPSNCVIFQDRLCTFVNYVSETPLACLFGLPLEISGLFLETIINSTESFKCEHGVAECVNLLET